ncbi:13863_t:CDS:2 [Funneliformis geosporum]|uniref:13863_t:CDS:1 n=1 Tax=Funneliformis geosporum TaxID=1117311 RepID=A0A9W4WUB5_9GLOM|nr:13863_t:CDS:2 [Funneliformis geosporum]
MDMRCKTYDMSCDASSIIYSPIWLEGPRWIRDEGAEQWTRNGPTKVALKKLHNSQLISKESLNQIYEFHRVLHFGSIANFFGITKDPSSNYMFVMRYYENRDLHSYLDEAQGMFCWRHIVEMLWRISGGIEYIHENGLIHGNIHGGNLLVENELDLIDIRISDVGLYGPVGNNNPNEVYGVLPYVAPEILKGGLATKA